MNQFSRQSHFQSQNYQSQDGYSQISNQENYSQNYQSQDCYFQNFTQENYSQNIQSQDRYSPNFNQENYSPNQNQDYCQQHFQSQGGYSRQNYQSQNNFSQNDQSKNYLQNNGGQKPNPKKSTIWRNLCTRWNRLQLNKTLVFLREFSPMPKKEEKSRRTILYRLVIPEMVK